MSFFNEFPFTRNYDSDLGWLIRYVKKLMQKFERCPTWYGEWVAEIEYPALAFVQYGTNGDTYMSIRNVPANTPITDENYWVNTGSTSEQILDLQRRMAAAESSIETLETDVTRMNNRKIVFVADSYGTRTDSDGKTVAQILRSNGWNVVFDYSYGGAGFTKQGIYDIKSYPEMYTGDMTEVTDVVYACSANDTLSDFVTVRDSVGAGIAVAKTLYPNAKIHVIPWGCIFKDGENAANLIRVTIPAYKFACYTYGAACLKNAEYTLRNTSLLENDYIHPTPLGVAYLARAVMAALESEIYDVEYTAYITAQAVSSDITSFVAKPILMRRKNSIVTIEIDSGSLTDNMFVIEHTEHQGAGFTLAGVAIRFSQSLLSVPKSNMNGRSFTIYGVEAATADSGSPVTTFGAVMNCVIVTNEMFVTIDPDVWYKCKRFTSKQCSVVIND